MQFFCFGFDRARVLYRLRLSDATTSTLISDVMPRILGARFSAGTGAVHKRDVLKSLKSLFYFRSTLARFLRMRIARYATG